VLDRRSPPSPPNQSRPTGKPDGRSALDQRHRNIGKRLIRPLPEAVVAQV
jgi:hypothetical protein